MPKCPNCGHEFNDHPSNMLESEKWFWEKTKSNVKMLKIIIRYGPFAVGLASLEYLLFLSGYHFMSADRQVQAPMFIVFGIVYLLYVRRQFREYRDKYEMVGIWDILNQ